MKRIYKLAGMAVLGLFANTQNMNAQMVSDFESINLAPESYWDGSDLSGANGTTRFTSIFESGSAGFLNVWDITWGLPGYWSEGFAQSSNTDSTTSGAGNLFSARAGSGSNGSLTYLVSQNNSVMEFINGAADTSVNGIYVTNGTYAANSMRDGDSFAKKFGGATGNDPDWFMLTVKAFDSTGTILPDSVDFYLADFRDANNANDYIVTDWQFIDLSSLGNVRGLLFSLSSSDVGTSGMNTPAFFCIDDIKSDGAALVDFEDLGFTAVDSVWNGSDLTGTPNDLNFVSNIADGDAEFYNSYTTSWGGYWKDGFAFSNITDSVTSGSVNLYSAKPAMGALGSTNYAIVQDGSSVNLTGNAANSVMSGVYLANSTFAYNSMRDGDSFAKKFGGITGNDPDWLKLTIRGYNNGVMNSDTIDFYLADFRDSDNSNDYILDSWNWLDLSPLGTVDSVTFSMSSSDMGAWGMNTPAFFAMDNFNGVLSTVGELSQNTISVYPNPAINQIQIKEANGTGTVQIFNMKGSLQWQESNVSATSIINIESLKSGVYMVKYMENDNVSMQRIIVQ